MGHLPFSKPVFLKLEASGIFQARGPKDAAEYLEHHWPAERTAHYRQAKVLCRAAADGLVESETARVALTDAAHRAGALADGGAFSDVSHLPGDIPWGALLPVDTIGPEVSDWDLVGYYRASDIIDDPSLSPSRKRALLAHWGSDANAVAGAPALRCVRGVTVTIDSIIDAMCALDAEVDQAAMTKGGPDAGRTW